MMMQEGKKVLAREIMSEVGYVMWNKEVSQSHNIMHTVFGYKIQVFSMGFISLETYPVTNKISLISFLVNDR